MASNTSRLNLYKPADDGSENVDVSSDLNQNLDKIDSSVGFIPATSSTPPTSTFAGMSRQDTDTNRTFYRNGADAQWNEIPNSVGVFDANLRLAEGRRLAIGTTSPTSLIDAKNADESVLPAKFTTGADTQPKVTLDWDGLYLGPGGSTVHDTYIFRAAPNLLVTSALAVQGDADIAGDASVDNLIVTGNLEIDGVVNTALTVAGTFQATGIGGRWIKYKSINLARQSTTTPTADPDLTIPLLANTAYMFRISGGFASAAAADFRSSLTVPAGTTGTKQAIGPGSAATTIDNLSAKLATFAPTSNVDYGTANNSSYSGFQESGVLFVGSTAGNLTFNWSQVVSTASDTTLGFGTYMEVVRLT
jgi:hypothetical protein